jgi:hypothetical protein
MFDRNGVGCKVLYRLMMSYDSSSLRSFALKVELMDVLRLTFGVDAGSIGQTRAPGMITWNDVVKWFRAVLCGEREACAPGGIMGGFNLIGILFAIRDVTMTLCCLCVARCPSPFSQPSFPMRAACAVWNQIRRHYPSFSGSRTRMGVGASWTKRGPSKWSKGWGKFTNPNPTRVTVNYQYHNCRWAIENMTKQVETMVFFCHDISIHNVNISTYICIDIYIYHIYIYHIYISYR